MLLEGKAAALFLILLVNFQIFAAVVAKDDGFMNGLHLKKNAKSFTQTLTNDIITTIDGKEYSLDGKLVPLSDVFSNKNFLVLGDGSEVLDLATDEVYPVPVYRATYDDGTIVQVSKDKHGVIEYAEVHQRKKKNSIGGSNNKQPPVTILVKDDSEEGYLTFQEGSIGSNTAYGVDGILPPTNRRRNRLLRGAADETPPQQQRRDLFTYQRGDGTSSECELFKTVEIAIAFDSSYCILKGGAAGAIQHIGQVVAGASLFYEEEMCTKLSLTGIYGTCDENQDEFKVMNPDNPCTSTPEGEAHFLFQFSEWQRTNRDRANFNGETLVHLFSGAEIKTAAVGCAYIGTICNISWGAGIDYMRFGILENQIILFAHEVGHNLGMMHNDNDGNYIMRPFVTSGELGFHPDSINRAMDKFNAPNTCVRETQKFLLGGN